MNMNIKIKEFNQNILSTTNTRIETDLDIIVSHHLKQIIYEEKQVKLFNFLKTYYTSQNIIKNFYEIILQSEEIEKFHIKFNIILFENFKELLFEFIKKNIFFKLSDKKILKKIQKLFINILFKDFLDYLFTNKLNIFIENYKLITTNQEIILYINNRSSNNITDGCLLNSLVIE